MLFADGKEAQTCPAEFHLSRKVIPMRVLLKVKLRHDTFNAAVRDGSAGQKMKRILDETKPEAVYFTELEGHRTAILIVDLPDASKLPPITEPWFLQFMQIARFAR
jgi:hypothetical protein